MKKIIASSTIVIDVIAIIQSGVNIEARINQALAKQQEGGGLLLPPIPLIREIMNRSDIDIEYKVRGVAATVNAYGLAYDSMHELSDVIDEIWKLSHGIRPLINSIASMFIAHGKKESGVDVIEITAKAFVEEKNKIVAIIEKWERDSGYIFKEIKEKLQGLDFKRLNAQKIEKGEGAPLFRIKQKCLVDTMSECNVFLNLETLSHALKLMQWTEKKQWNEILDLEVRYSLWTDSTLKLLWAYILETMRQERTLNAKVAAFVTTKSKELKTELNQYRQLTRLLNQKENYELVFSKETLKEIVELLNKSSFYRHIILSKKIDDLRLKTLYLVLRGMPIQKDREVEKIVDAIIKMQEEGPLWWSNRVRGAALYLKFIQIQHTDTENFIQEITKLLNTLKPIIDGNEHLIEAIMLNLEKRGLYDWACHIGYLGELWILELEAKGTQRMVYPRNDKRIVRKVKVGEVTSEKRQSREHSMSQYLKLCRLEIALKYNLWYQIDMVVVEKSAEWSDLHKLLVWVMFAKLSVCETEDLSNMAVLKAVSLREKTPVMQNMQNAMVMWLLRHNTYPNKETGNTLLQEMILEGIDISSIVTEDIWRGYLLQERDRHNKAGQTALDLYRLMGGDNERVKKAIADEAPLASLPTLTGIPDREPTVAHEVPKKVKEKRRGVSHTEDTPTSVPEGSGGDVPVVSTETRVVLERGLTGQKFIRQLKEWGLEIEHGRGGSHFDVRRQGSESRARVWAHFRGGDIMREGTRHEFQSRLEELLKETVKK